jgi:hypothetical protein
VLQNAVVKVRGLPIDWKTIIVAMLAGGSLDRLLSWGIMWIKEKREQRSAKTSHEKDRPRFRIDVTKTKTDHADVPAFVVEILSLGSLPLTINYGEAFVTAEHYPERVQTEKFDNREIGPVHPIKVKFALPPKVTNPLGGGKPLVKLVCHFSYGENNQEYAQEWKYNQMSGKFEELH